MGFESSSLTNNANNLCGRPGWTVKGAIGTSRPELDKIYSLEQDEFQVRKLLYFELKSLILAQIERWRHA